MRRFLFGIIVAVVAFVAIPGAAGANHSAGQGPKQDLAVGTGKIEQFGTFVHANAHSEPDGTDAKGSFFVRQTFHRLPLDFAGKVTCLRVTGNQAVVGGEVTRNYPVEPGGVLPNPAEGTGVLIDMRDNDANGTPDTLNFTFRPAPPEVCPPLNTHQFGPVEGQVIVHDAT